MPTLARMAAPSIQSAISAARAALRPRLTPPAASSSRRVVSLAASRISCHRLLAAAGGRALAPYRRRRRATSPGSPDSPVAVLLHTPAAMASTSKWPSCVVASPATPVVVLLLLLLRLASMSCRSCWAVSAKSAAELAMGAPEASSCRGGGATAAGWALGCAVLTAAPGPCGEVPKVVLGAPADPFCVALQLHTCLRNLLRVSKCCGVPGTPVPLLLDPACRQPSRLTELGHCLRTVPGRTCVHAQCLSCEHSPTPGDRECAAMSVRCLIDNQRHEHHRHTSLPKVSAAYAATEHTPTCCAGSTSAVKPHVVRQRQTAS
jgi:hypothetical protein